MRRSLWSVFLLIALIGLFALLSENSVRLYSRVTASSAPASRSSEWNHIIASNVNSKVIKLVVDGKEQKTDSDSLFMNEDMQLMMDYDVVQPAFSCAADLYYNSLIILQKYNDRIIMHVGEDKILKNDESVSIEADIVEKNGRIYIPADAIEKALGYKSEWNVNTCTMSFSNERPDEIITPYVYDYRLTGKITQIKNQNSFGTCWAFASLMAVETALAPEAIYDFSEDHMSLNNSFSSDQNDGGEYTMSMAYLAAWQGPVFEKDDPYGDGYSPDNLEAVLHVQEMQIIKNKSYEEIKKAIFLKGGVQSSLYVNLDNIYTRPDAFLSDSGAYYNPETYAYCYIGPKKANHDIVIIGWDDRYPASNFVNEPEGDGAFICINSWGEKFGEAGVFYVSYFDSNIGVRNVVYTGIEPADNYDNIYQTDLCGWVGQIGYNREYAYFANVYTAKENEFLKAVSFYATGVNTEYEVYLVEDFENEESFVNRKKLTSGKFINAGYYTVPISDEVHLKAGGKYAVVVYINTPAATQPVAVEYRADDSTANVIIDDGIGYVSLHGTLWQNTESVQECNICLKMFTDTEEKQ